ncbi:hypothetical protein AB0B45_48320 [Nonomuraea sp. NPDC049152]|uniref:hypothetical protein n=1 Tax=Nonomuraea sp. NPDC049152 TaxID=3154350 RepID=UPI0033E2FBFC
MSTVALVVADGILHFELAADPGRRHPGAGPDRLDAVVAMLGAGKVGSLRGQLGGLAQPPALQEQLRQAVAREQAVVQAAVVVGEA